MISFTPGAIESRREEGDCSPAAGRPAVRRRTGGAGSGGRALRRIGLCSAALLAACATVARAGDAGGEGEWSWWRPPQAYSTHAPQIDLLYYVILAITSVTLVAVWVTMGVFLVKYRHRPGRKKALFTHGNTRLEIVWTLIPAVILIVLALWTKRAWDNYRYSPTANNADLARLLVIGQQFKWNVVYPGPDGKLGRYLIFPKTTDITWPAPDPKDPYPFPTSYEGRPVSGPAFMPEGEARKVINTYIDQKNPLGKDFSDPAGADDDWVKDPGREINVPKGRPVEISLSSKDVIHDFFLPNYRVKLDAVPGMRGLIYFTATTSSAELEAKSRKEYGLDELSGLIANKGAVNYKFVILATDPKAEDDGTSLRYFRETTKKKRVKGKMQDVTEKETVIRNGDDITEDRLKDLRDAGFSRVLAFVPKRWDLVCEELCGQGHYTMKGQLVVLEPEEFKKRFETPAAAPVAAGAAGGTVGAIAAKP